MAKARMKAKPVVAPMGGDFYYDREHDTNDQKPWSEAGPRLLCRPRRQRTHALTYVYFEEGPGRRAAAKLLTNFWQN